MDKILICKVVARRSSQTIRLTRIATSLMQRGYESLWEIRIQTFWRRKRSQCTLIVSSNSRRSKAKSRKRKDRPVSTAINHLHFREASSSITQCLTSNFSESDLLYRSTASRWPRGYAGRMLTVWRTCVKSWSMGWILQRPTQHQPWLKSTHHQWWNHKYNKTEMSRTGAYRRSRWMDSNRNSSSFRLKRKKRKKRGIRRIENGLLIRQTGWSGEW